MIELSAHAEKMMRLLLATIMVQGAFADCLGDLTAWSSLITSGAECDPVKLNWCSDGTCLGSVSKFYDDCKDDPIYGTSALAMKSTLETLGCEPTSGAFPAPAPALPNASGSPAVSRVPVLDLHGSVEGDHQDGERRSDRQGEGRREHGHQEAARDQGGGVMRTELRGSANTRGWVPRVTASPTTWAGTDV